MEANAQCLSHGWANKAQHMEQMAYGVLGEARRLEEEGNRKTVRDMLVVALVSWRASTPRTAVSRAHRRQADARTTATMGHEGGIPMASCSTTTRRACERPQRVMWAWLIAASRRTRRS